MLRILIFILLLISYSINAQTQFSKTINVDSLGGSLGIAIEYLSEDSTLIIQSLNGHNNVTKAGLNKVSLSGDIIWDKTYTADPYWMGFDDSAGSMIINANGNITMAGSVLSANPDNLSDYFLMSVNVENGDSLWAQVYPNVGHDLAKTLVQFEDEGFLVGGTNGYSSTRDILLLRTDSLGVITWEKKYDNYFYLSDIFTIHLNENEDIFIGTQILENEGEDSDPYIGKLSDELEGEIIIDENWGTNVNECPIRLGNFSNGSDFIASWCESVNQDVTPFSYVKLRKIDSELGAIWNYQFPLLSTGWRFIYNLEVLEDGSIIGLGNVVDEEFFEEMEDVYDLTIWSMAWLFKISPDGELEWERMFYDSKYLRYFNIHDLIQTPNGTIYTVGETTEYFGIVANSDSTALYPLYDNDIWLVGFDENGCLNGDCGPDNGDYWDLSRQQVATEDILSSTQSKTLQLYPNPSSGLFTVRWNQKLEEDNELEIFDMTGRKVLNQNILSYSTNVEIDLSAFPSGMYWVSFMGEKAAIVTYTP